MTVDIQVEHRDPDLPTRRLGAMARQVLAAVERPAAELSILLVDDVRMRALNREYRGIDRTTDVLAFPQGADAAEVERGVPDLLGDLVIAVPTARRNARRYRHSLERELERLLVHGVLHLLGHDHKKAAERTRMRAAERRALSRLRQRVRGG